MDSTIQWKQFFLFLFFCLFYWEKSNVPLERKEPNEIKKKNSNFQQFSIEFLRIEIEKDGLRPNYDTYK